MIDFLESVRTRAGFLGVRTIRVGDTLVVDNDFHGLREGRLIRLEADGAGEMHVVCSIVASIDETAEQAAERRMYESAYRWRFHHLLLAFHHVRLAGLGDPRDMSIEMSDRDRGLICEARIAFSGALARGDCSARARRVHRLQQQTYLAVLDELGRHPMDTPPPPAPAPLVAA